MYNYDFKNKNIIIELVNIMVSIGEETLYLNLIVTEEEVLLFKNIRANTIFSGRGIYELPEYELVFNKKLKELDYVIDEGNTIINLNDKDVIIYNFELSKVKI